MSNVIDFPLVERAAVCMPDDWRLFVAIDGLLSILSSARDLEHARQIAAEALGTTNDGGAA